MAEKNEVQVSFSEQLTDKLISIKDALPKDFNRERFVQNTIAVLNEKPELQKANKAQLLLGLVKGAMLNLNYQNREFYLLPYGNTVNFQFDYRGLAKVAKQYSIRPIKEIHSDLVREGDKFQFSIVDNNQVVNFEPIPFSDADIVGVFTYIEYEDGSIVCERMSVKDVNDVRNNYSKQSNGNAWSKSWGEMARKSCIRRALKTVELSFENAEAKKIYDEEADAEFVVKKPKAEDIVNVFAEEKIVEIADDVVEIVEDDMPDFLKGDK